MMTAPLNYRSSAGGFVALAVTCGGGRLRAELRGAQLMRAKLIRQRYHLPDDNRARRVAGATSTFSAAASAVSSPSVPIHVRAAADDADEQHGGGRLRRPSTLQQVLRERAREPRPISTTIVVECGVSRIDASARTPTANDRTRRSRSTTSPRCVTGMPASAGAASADETPGTISKGTPAAASAIASSPPRPNTNGSPHFSLTTRLPRRAPRTIRHRLIAS